MAGNRNRISGRDHFRKDDTKILSILSLDYLTLKIRQIVPFFFRFFRSSSKPSLTGNRVPPQRKEIYGSLPLIKMSEDRNSGERNTAKIIVIYFHIQGICLRVTVTTRSPEIVCSIF